MLTPDVLPRKSSEVALGSEVHQKILDAAVEIFVEFGYSQACTNNIARRAGVSVGSIYRFFPNKFALYNGIAERFLAGLDGIVSESLQSAGAEEPWQETIDRYIDNFGRFFRENAALVRAWNVLLGNPEIRESDRRYTERAVTMWADYLADVVPDRSPAEYQRIAKVIYWSTTSVLELSVADISKFRQEMIEETKVLVKAYLSRLLAPQPPEGALT